MKHEAIDPPRTLEQIDSDLRDKLHFRMLSKVRGETRTAGFDALLDERLALRASEVEEPVTPTASSPYPLAMKRR